MQVLRFFKVQLKSFCLFFEKLSQKIDKLGENRPNLELLVIILLAICPWQGLAISGEYTFGHGRLSPWDEKGRPKNGFEQCAVLVRIVGLDPPKGILRIALYDSKKSYDRRSHPVRSEAVEVTSSNATVKFDALKPGFYAIMMYHDTNRNNKFDRIFGLPREQYGFSNNAVPGLGPPSFDSVKFKVQPRDVTFIKIIAR